MAARTDKNMVYKNDEWKEIEVDSWEAIVSSVALLTHRANKMKEIAHSNTDLVGIRKLEDAYFWLNKSH